MSRIFRTALLACGVVASVSVSAFAAGPTRVSGTLDAVQGNALTIAPATGDKVTVALKDDAKVFLMAPVKPGDIKSGEFIGVGAVKGADGALLARSIFVFPEALRGAGEGQRPWDVLPNGVMTNATIDGVAAAPTGSTIKLTYKGGAAEVATDAETVITTASLSDRSVLTPGKVVSVFATPATDGTLTAGGGQVYADGMKPAF